MKDTSVTRGDGRRNRLFLVGICHLKCTTIDDVRCVGERIFAVVYFRDRFDYAKSCRLSFVNNIATSCKA